MKDFWKQIAQIFLMALALYSVLLGSYWIFVGEI